MAEAVVLHPVPKGKAGKGANFSKKSKRKAERKKLVQKVGVRGHIANTVADKRLGYQERMAFYRGLRELKMRRRKIAGEFARLVTMVAGMQREAQHVLDRYPDVDAGLVQEAVLLAKRAHGSVAAAGDELHAFAQRKVYFTEFAGVAA